MTASKKFLAFTCCLVQLAAAVTVIFLFHETTNEEPVPLRPSLARKSPPTFKKELLHIDSLRTGYAVKTPSCAIPDFDPYNPAISPQLKDPAPNYIGCNESLPLITFVDGEYLRLNVTLVQQFQVTYCGYEEVQRISDNSIKYGQPVRFTSDVRPETDFVRVRCYNGSDSTRIYTNFHAIVRRKSDVESRCQERLEKILKDGTSSDDVMNVLMIGIDSTSRQNAIRRLNATRRYFLDRLEAVELRGYSRIGDNTYPNVMALLTGRPAEERPAGRIDRTPLLWYDFSAAGYRTLYAEDAFIDNHVFNIWVDSVNDPGGFSKVPADYYFRPLNVAFNDDKEAVKGDYRLGPTCIGPTFETDFMLHWVHDFVCVVGGVCNETARQSARTRPFFSFAFFSSVTHADMNEAAHVDASLVEFFQRLEAGSTFNETAVILFSDHGARFGTTRGWTRMGWYEENLPMALLALPPSFRQRHRKMMDTLRANADRLTTPFDLHESLRRLLSLSRPYNETERMVKKRRGLSLFDVSLGDRTCEQASIAPTYCECLLSSTSSVSVSDPGVVQSANGTVEYINTELSVYNGSCARLRLFRVLEAQTTRHTATMISGHHIYYTMTFQTMPGNGTFQSIVERLNSGGVVVLGDILRLNAYRQHAGCIHHIVHQKWCYCLLRTL